ncbi:MAG: hypothetical protein JXA14_05735 [Anaerolineae bacterium]|nr:hypothetical protein [Anaerolineae bacterium]
MANKLSQAVRLIEAGKEKEARQALAEVLKSDPANDEAWVMMAAVAKTDELREKYLREALKLNSGNQTALRALKSLKERQRHAATDSTKSTVVPIPRTQDPSGILKGIAYAAGVVVVTAAILGIALFLQREQLTGEASWKEFTSEEGRFSILLPRTPRQTTETVDTPVGEIDERSFTVIHGSITYIVSYSDYPQNVLSAGDPQAILDSFSDSAVTSIEGKLLSERSISLDGYLGRELKIKIADDSDTAIAQIRIYLVGNRLYYIYTLAPEERASSPSVDKFLNSFKLVR